MPKIRNLDRLLSVGDVESRRVVLDIAEQSLQRLDAYKQIRSMTSLEGDMLRIGTRTWDLSTKRHVYLVGAGKACNHMAMAIDELLGDRLTDGVAIVKIAEDTDQFSRTRVYVGGHPIPNEKGLQASKEILALADAAGPGDLFIAVVSGGSSALMSCPVDGISLEEEMAATDVLLRSGANIYQINAIRRHISQTNGGRLAQRIAATGAELVGIGISDAVGHEPTQDASVPYERYTATPIGPDQTTLKQARQVIDDFGLADQLPRSVVDYLRAAGPEQETPKAFPRNTYFRLNTVPDSCRYARQAAEAIGLPAVILTTCLEGESREAGTVLASIAREIQARGNPIAAPCVLLASGETTTIIPDDVVPTGHGGPGQELVTGFALAAATTVGAAALSIDSEGTDGTTLAAGGICDSTSLGRARAAGISLHAALRGHATYEALDAIGDIVVTGNTGTNLCDLNIVYVPAAPGGQA